MKRLCAAILSGVTVLLAVPDTVLPDWKAGDMNNDNRLDARDLTMLKYVLM